MFDLCALQSSDLPTSTQLRLMQQLASPIGVKIDLPNTWPARARVREIEIPESLSFYIVLPESENTDRTSCGIVSELEYLDFDGIPVQALLHVNKSKYPIEVFIWKGDSSLPSHVPDPLPEATLPRPPTP